MFLYLTPPPPKKKVAVRWCYLVLKVGHSIGAYIGIEVFKRLQQQVINVPKNKALCVLSWSFSCMKTLFSSHLVCLTGQICHRVIPVFVYKQQFLNAIHDQKVNKVTILVYYNIWDAFPTYMDTNACLLSVIFANQWMHLRLKRLYKVFQRFVLKVQLFYVTFYYL